MRVSHQLRGQAMSGAHCNVFVNGTGGMKTFYTDTGSRFVVTNVEPGTTLTGGGTAVAEGKPGDP